MTELKHKIEIFDQPIWLPPMATDLAASYLAIALEMILVEDECWNFRSFLRCLGKKGGGVVWFWHPTRTPEDPHDHYTLWTQPGSELDKYIHNLNL